MIKQEQIVSRKLADLRQPEKNARMHPEKQIKEYVRSLEKNGQLKLLVIDENNVIWIGNGLYQAMIAHGDTEAMCLLKTGMSEAEKKKMMLADNRIFNLGVDDLDAFDEIIRELERDFDIPGYDDRILETITADIEAADEMMSGYGIISTDTKQQMQRASEQYVEDDRRFSDNAERVSPSGAQSVTRAEELNGVSEKPAEHIPNTPIAQNVAEKPAEALSKRYMVCPKCGEKIWL